MQSRKAVKRKTRLLQKYGPISYRAGTTLSLDACSDRGFAAYDRLFTSDRKMHSLAVANKNPLARALVKLLPDLRSAEECSLFVVLAVAIQQSGAVDTSQV